MSLLTNLAPSHLNMVTYVEEKKPQKTRQIEAFKKTKLLYTKNISIKIKDGIQ